MSYIYTLAGCSGFDVSAKPEIVQACKEGIDRAWKHSTQFFKNEYKPFVTVSVGMPGDHHVRKAIITDGCVTCNLCIPVCPTDAIPNNLIIDHSLCGCGNVSSLSASCKCYQL